MLKKILKNTLLVLLVAFIAIQFFRPAKNRSTGPESFAKDITTVHRVPDDVQAIFKKACNDCHSNNTEYPWYNNIQPVAWWLANHIKEGKKELNLSEFAGYSLRRQYGKLDKINSEVKEGGMPLSSYTFIHRNAILDESEKLAIANWTTALRDSMKAVYPADSLARKKPAAK
jgi:mono/diheme cytochrome c family protein